jgi:WD40-like Beta Propeller Repeat
MKNNFPRITGFIILAILILLPLSDGCKKSTNPIKYQLGTFPDSVYNLEGLNSPYDDKNSDVYVLGNQMPIIFSTNRASNGGQFDLLNGVVNYKFDQTNGNFTVTGTVGTDPFYSTIAQKANTAGDDLGPFTLFNNSDGFEYLFVASQVSGGQLDLFFEKYLPRNGDNVPVITGPNPVTVLNSSSDDAYLTFNYNQDSAYFCSNRGGNYDIYVQARPDSVPLSTWLVQSFSAATLVDSLNSSKDDKCPFIYKNIMVFASDRDGGLGGFDLYYSVFRNGNWSAPTNFGPGINTKYNEYRPVIGYDPGFTNKLLIFSSDRPGGKGGYDLYFTGFDFPN